MKKASAIICVILVLSGCATPHSPSPNMDNRRVESSSFDRVYDAPFEKVWEAALKATEGDTLKEVKKENGFISVVHDAYHPFKYVRFSLGMCSILSTYIWVTKKDDSHTIVKIDMKVMGSTSRGVLEKYYLDRIDNNLK